MRAGGSGTCKREALLGATAHAAPPTPLQPQRALEQPIVGVDVGVDELAVRAVVEVERRLACVRVRIRVSRDGGLCSVAKAYAFVMGEWP